MGLDTVGESGRVRPRIEGQSADAGGAEDKHAIAGCASAQEKSAIASRLSFNNADGIQTCAKREISYRVPG